MGKIQKLIEKLERKYIPRDMKYDEIIMLAQYYGCEIKNSGGKHPFKIISRKCGVVIPIPRHGKNVPEAYVRQIKKLFAQIEEIEKEES